MVGEGGSCGGGGDVVGAVRFGGLFSFFFNDTAATKIYTEEIVGSVRCV